jgi:glucose/arabinose dehydrogenase
VNGVRTAALIAGILIAAVAVSILVRRGTGCDDRLRVPEGFCASVYADDVGPARHIAVVPNGDVYVATWREGQRSGGVVALRDSNGDGRADLRRRFGPEGGSGIATRGQSLWFATWGQVLRYDLSTDSLGPAAEPEVVVTGLPALEHGARSIAVDSIGHLFVNIGVSSNACERDYPSRDFRGQMPCRELGNSGGIWVFDARGTQQLPTLQRRFATGLRHTIALAVNPLDGRLYGAPHGIDHLDRWWPSAGYSALDAANVPAETMFRIDSAGDYRFPYCLFDPRAGAMKVAPAYLGEANAPACDSAPVPVATFAAHSAPMAIAWSVGPRFSPDYAGAAFIALHGSLFHAPDKPRGYSVKAIMPGTGEIRDFAVARSRLGSTSARPSGLAFLPDGSLLIADDYGKRIWIVRRTTER